MFVRYNIHFFFFIYLTFYGPVLLLYNYCKNIASKLWWNSCICMTRKQNTYASSSYKLPNRPNFQKRTKRWPSLPHPNHSAIHKVFWDTLKLILNESGNSHIMYSDNRHIFSNNLILCRCQISHKPGETVLIDKRPNSSGNT